MMMMMMNNNNNNNYNNNYNYNQQQQQQQEEDYKNLLKEPEWTTLSGKDVDLKKLLRWGLENATANEDTTTKTTQNDLKDKKIDTKWLDIIMGKSDTVRMKECMEVILKEEEDSDSEEIEDQHRALDELELLVEDLDNSKDFVRLNMLDPLLMLLSRLKRQQVKKSKMVLVGILWVMGTMVQNNPLVKKAYLEKNVLDLVLDLFLNGSDTVIRGKCLYCISGLMKHNTPAQAQFAKLQGYKKLYEDVLKTSSSSSLSCNNNNNNAQLVQKVLFLFYNVMLDDEQNGVKLVGGVDEQRSLVKTLLGLLEKYSTVAESEEATICATIYNILLCLKKEIKLIQQERDALRNNLSKAEARFGRDQFDEATLKSLRDWTHSE
ncbi:hypothetical protein MP638_001825 [Amoeboaphelidium occidentale]|nr:hypothetical protein MP638_001825 [Amoeboaphelidium occidentale]